ncbi:hypothetical protein M514_02165 [Trichuris suis]|uniref:Proteasome subunit alpha type n=1 Tax=Trichuris suis TaxID=68888 RepID=A0A085N9K2_9BILA|nr:hypothetical protein M513_02165 [Trichuris suis]KFD66148.1 hypothetical protein M514_02165 [Trichuris suis]KHJ47342.1 peptidase, T1 family [Trichuris suis]
MSTVAGSGYDISSSTFSPDGRLFQVEYAMKAVDSSNTCIVMRGQDGVVFLAEKAIATKLLKSTTNTRISSVDEHIGFTCSGFYPDCRALLVHCSEEAQDYYKQFRKKIPCKELAEHAAMYIHGYTLYGAFRPFGCFIFLSSWDKENGPQLYGIDPSGACYGYKAWSVGKNRLAAKAELEKLTCVDKPVRELAREAVRIMYGIRDETVDKYFVLEMSWVSEETNGKHMIVPSTFLKEAEMWAKRLAQESDESE